MGLVADANVLIDYYGSDKSVLRLISRRLARIHIPTPVLEEVHGLTEKEAVDLAMEVVEPTLAQAVEAQARRGALSFQDRLCLAAARDAGWHLLTNDTTLRKASERAGVPCMWGLEPMALLVGSRQMRAPRALRAGQRIARANLYVTEEVLRRFRRRIGL